MELSFSQIKQYTKGALLVTQEPNEYRFTRFIPEQQKSFGEVFAPWEVRSHYTSGIRLDFHTDASALHIVVGAEGNYEVLVDDLCVFFSPVAAEESINVPLDSGDHRVTIVLPSLSCGTLRSVRLEGETYIKSHTYSTTAIFYGDSITQGSTSIKSSESYTWLLTRNYDWDSINFGVGGIRFQPEVMLDLGCQAEIVIVSLGTNNFGSNNSLVKLAMV